MKRFIYILLFVLSTPVYAQIDTNVMYDSTPKEIKIEVKNQFNEIIRLHPVSEKKQDSGFWYILKWRNKDKEEITSEIPLFIFGPRIGSYIDAQQTQTFQSNVKINHPNVEYVEIFIHPEIHIKDDKKWKNWKGEERTYIFNY